MATALLLAVSAVGCGSDRSTSLTALSVVDGTERWGRTDVLVGGAMETAVDALAVVGYERCSERGELTLVDPATGTTRWSTPIQGGFGPRSVAIAGDLVVSSDSSEVRGLELDEGSPRWTRTVAWPGPLVAAHDGIIAVAELVQSPDGRSFMSRLSSVEPTDGDTRWVATFDAEQVIDLAVDDGVVFARLSGTAKQRAGHTTVVTLSASDGDLRWTRDLGVSEIGTSLVIGDDTVVANLLTISWIDADGVQLGPSSAVVALDRVDGSERWRLDGTVDDGGPVGSSAAAFDASGSTVVGRDPEGLVVWDGDTGDVRWRLDGSPRDAWIVGDQVLWSPAIGPDDDGDRLEAADLATGDERWSFTTPRSVRDVGAADGTLLVGGADSPSCD